MTDAAAPAASASGDGLNAGLPDEPSLPIITGLFGNLLLSNAHQEGLYNLFNGYASQDPFPRGEELLHQIHEDLEPRELVHPMITVNYEMYKRIRFFLNDHGVDTRSTGASGGLIVNRILHTIWHLPEDEEERTKAVNQFKAIKRGEYIPPSPSLDGPNQQQNPFALPPNPAPPPLQSPNQQGNSRAWETSNSAKGMSTAYSYEKQKFHGKSDEDWLTKLSRYQFMCNQNKVMGNDRISYLHYMLDGAALQFFINDIEGKILNWGEVVRRFHDRYASAAKQDYISHRLNDLHISQFESGENATEARALRETIDELDRLTPMSHPEDRTDRSKMLRLQEAVIGRDWARTVLSNVTANELKYQTLIERLEYSLQQATKHRAASHGATDDSSTNQLRTSRWKSTNFAGQGRYANEPRSHLSIVPKQQSSYPTGRSSSQRTYPKERWPNSRSNRSPLTCHNCGKPGCRWYKCSEPINMQLVANNKLKYAASKSNSTTPSRVPMANVTDDLARDIDELMETMVVSHDADYTHPDDAAVQEELMATLEERAATEASINHVSFEPLPDEAQAPVDRDGDLDALEDFYHGA